MQASGPGHGGQGRPLATDVAEDLKNHEAEEEEVETGTNPCNNYECHLRQHQLRRHFEESADSGGAYCWHSETERLKTGQTQKHTHPIESRRICALACRFGLTCTRMDITDSKLNLCI